MVNEDTPPRRTRKRCSKSPGTNLRSPSANSNNSYDSNSDISDTDVEPEYNEDEVAGESPRHQHHQPFPVSYEPEGCVLRKPLILPQDIESKRRVWEIPDAPTLHTYDVQYSQRYGNNGSLTSYSCESTTNSQNSPSENNRGKSVRRDSVSKPKQTKIGSTCKCCFGCVLVVIIIVTVPWSLVSTADSTAVKTADEWLRPKRLNDFRTAIAAIRNKFPRQSQDTWMDIEAGVASVIDRSQKISVFLLFSNETRELRCLADYLGSASSKALLSENSLLLEPEDMGDEYGDAMDRWKDEIEERKAVVSCTILKL